MKLGSFIQTTAVLVMRPDDLVEFNRRYYSRPEEIQDWCNVRRVRSGLRDLEQSLLKKTGISSGKLLMLGLGGGREAIPLAKMGFEVTGVDYIPEMVEQAQTNARQNGVRIFGLVQDISRLDVPAGTFDMAWLSAGMYSCVPTRRRRIFMLQRIERALKPGGYFIFEFLWNPKAGGSAKMFGFKKLLAWLSLGNFYYQNGDILRFQQEFFHAFTTIEELRAEIAETGLKVVDIQLDEPYDFAGAVVRKPVIDANN
ncbi:class I SAM-dependent methyltransferase [candidate division KSB1 bacterium]|nr:class I SAM-dependent methyltransferase [candidate division KSB1 bacterium]